jgi:hypothetical protein
MLGKALLEMTEEKINALAERISSLLYAARKDPLLNTQLERTKNPSQYIEVANVHGYTINLHDLAVFLTLYKSDSTLVTINNLTGDSQLMLNWGNVSVGHLLSLCEEHGIVRPFCNLSRNPQKWIFGTPTNINSPKYKLGQCFLPRGHFAR